MKLYADIEKIEPQDDGTIRVWGIASSEAVDADGEVVAKDAIKTAIPDYLQWGAVREMHDPKKAAGTALDIAVQDDGKTRFGAVIVDSEAVKKVQAKVYKGFSIGGKVTARDPQDPKRITGIKLVEVSLVDRPANPESVLSFWKVEEPEADPTEPAKDAGVKKGMYSVGRLAELLEELNWLRESVAAEADREGDNSPLPAQLRSAASILCEILRNMVAEETTEMLNDEDYEMADQAKDVQKAEPPAKPDDAQKATADGVNAFAKLYTDQVTKTAQLEALLKVQGDKIAELEKMAAPGKAFLKGFAPSKEQDNGGSQQFEPIKKADGSIDQEATAQALIKGIHASGGFRFVG